MSLSYQRRTPLYHAAQLQPGTLARFLDGLTWPEIYRLDPALPRAWWRGAVVNAEDAGLLWWDAANRSWWLSDAGRAAVRGVA